MRSIVGRCGLCLVLLAVASVAAANNQDKAVSPPPIPAVYPAPLAVHSLLLDVTKAGQHKVAVGAHGDILVSQANGQWKQVQSPVSTMLNAVAFADAKQGWAVGSTGVILHSSDGGYHWSIQFRDTSSGQVFYDIYAKDARDVLVLGKGRVVHTTDGGRHWQDMQGPLFQLKWNFNAITRLNNGCLMLVGERGLMARSCHGITDWQQLKPPYIGSYYGVLPYGPDGAVVYGMRGHVYVARDVTRLDPTDSSTWGPYKVKTVTDPKTLKAMGWRRIKTPVDQSLYAGSLDADGNAVFAGASGNVIAGSLVTGKLRLVPNTGNAPYTAFIRQGNRLLMVGRNGVGHLMLHPATTASEDGH